MLKVNADMSRCGFMLLSKSGSKMMTVKTKISSPKNPIDVDKIELLHKSQHHTELPEYAQRGADDVV